MCKTNSDSTLDSEENLLKFKQDIRMGMKLDWHFEHGLVVAARLVAKNISETYLLGFSCTAMAQIYRE